MAMNYYLKDLYPGSGMVQTTEKTIPDAEDKAEIVENDKAAVKANETTGERASGVKIGAAAIALICIAVFLSVSR